MVNPILMYIFILNANLTSVTTILFNMSVQNCHGEELFGDAVIFYKEFLAFLEHSPRSSPPSTLHARVEIDYVEDIGGKSLIAILYTRESTVQGDLKEWWKTNVLHPVQLFLNRFECADVVSITYIWW
jgi:hypothetical protein